VTAEAALVGVGGALGAVARYAVGQLIDGTAFPWPTLLVNAAGSFLLGAVVLGSADAAVASLVGTGFCGAFTTFSSFSFETVELWERGRRRLAALNATGNLAASLAAFGLAWVVVA